MRTQRPSRQRGLSLISLMIALLIGTFLLAGLFTMWFQTRTTFKVQNLMGQLQDNQRMALIILGNAVQTAGYYPVAANYSSTPPNPLYQPSTVFPASSTYSAAGQTIYGTHSGSANDTLSVRFLTDTAAGVSASSNTASGNTLDCMGQTQAAGTLVSETFSIDSANNLSCQIQIGSQTSTIGVLVPNVKTFTVYYGVSTSNTKSVTEYLTADQVTANALWSLVQSVNVQLTFVNPLYGVAGAPGQSATVYPVARTIALTQTAL